MCVFLYYILCVLFAGHPEAVRANIDAFSVKQNMQMSRLFDVRGMHICSSCTITLNSMKTYSHVTDPNVEVIYISPVTIDTEVLDYYHKMLAMGPAGDEGKERVHIITPEAVRHFPGRNMALSTLLLYSPKSLDRVKNLVAGREAYIVSGVVNRDDIAVADELGKELMVLVLCNVQSTLCSTESTLCRCTCVLH